MNSVSSKYSIEETDNVLPTGKSILNVRNLLADGLCEQNDIL